MKKISLLLAALLISVFGIFAIASGEDTNEEPKKEQDSGVVETTSAPSDNELDGFSVTIDSCRIAKDYDGKPIVIVKYIFTNNEDTPAAFYLTVSDSVFQNGVGLKETYFLDDSANYSSDNQTKEVKKSIPIEVEKAYVLEDTVNDIEVEVKKLISFDDTTITKIFIIAE